MDSPGHYGSVQVRRQTHSYRVARETAEHRVSFLHNVGQNMYYPNMEYLVRPMAGRVICASLPCDLTAATHTRPSCLMQS